MNVFVLSTGRCGSTTFERACRHITNYTAGHETRAAILGPARLDYPPDHIESDNRLAWFLGRLDQRYGDDAFYVHLTRDPAAVARSYARRRQAGMILPAYAQGIYLGLTEALDDIALAAAQDYVATVTANIEVFLRNKPQRMAFALANAQQDFARLWARIGAEGDLDAALAEFDQAYNAGPPKQA